MAARRKEGYTIIEKNVSKYFVVCKGLTIDDVGVSRDTVFQEIRPGAGFETADLSLKETLGGLYRRTASRRPPPALGTPPEVNACAMVPTCENKPEKEVNGKRVYARSRPPNASSGCDHTYIAFVLVIMRTNMREHIPHPNPRLAKKGCLSGHFVIRCFTHGEHDNFMTCAPRFLPRRRERRAGQLVRTHAAKNVARCDTLSGLCRANNAFRHLLRVAEIATKPLRPRNSAAANCMLCLVRILFSIRCEATTGIKF